MSKALTLKEVDSDLGQSLWVLNKTNPRGVININMPDGLGGTIIMSIPITWIPIDLTTQATKESLLKSPVFRRMIAGGNIVVIGEHEAEVALKEEGAQEEAHRIYSTATNPDLAPATNPELNKLTKEESGSVSGFAMNIVGLELEDDKLITMIKGQDGILTKEDYEYITQSSPSGKVKEYCAQVLVSFK